MFKNLVVELAHVLQMLPARNVDARAADGGSFGAATVVLAKTVAHQIVSIANCVHIQRENILVYKSDFLQHAKRNTLPFTLRSVRENWTFPNALSRTLDERPSLDSWR